MRFRAVYHTTPDNWDAIASKHRQILSAAVRNREVVLEVGCGWGRLLDLMPAEWYGPYTGIDLSPDFIALAKTERTDPRLTFVCGRAEDVLPTLAPKSYSLGVVVSVRRMLQGNGRGELWDEIERGMKRVCDRLLVLEYDADGEGEVLQ